MFGYHYIAERIGHQSETIGGYMRELEGLGLVHIPPAKRGAKKHVQILWQPSRGVSPAIGEIPDLPPVPTRHHATGTHGSAAKSLEMKRYAKVEPSRRTGNISTNLPDEQETNLPDERDTTFPANRNPLSYEASYEGVVVGNSSYEDSFSYLTTHEAADLEFYVAADFETGELLEAPPDDGRRDLSDAELDEWEQPDCPVIFDDWYVNSTAGAFEADGELFPSPLEAPNEVDPALLKKPTIGYHRRRKELTGANA